MRQFGVGHVQRLSAIIGRHDDDLCLSGMSGDNDLIREERLANLR